MRQLVSIVTTFTTFGFHKSFVNQYGEGCFLSVFLHLEVESLLAILRPKMRSRWNVRKSFIYSPSGSKSIGYAPPPPGAGGIDFFNGYTFL